MDTAEHPLSDPSDDLGLGAIDGYRGVGPTKPDATNPLDNAQRRDTGAATMEALLGLLQLSAKGRESQRKAGECRD
jgi:hypothetical protein